VDKILVSPLFSCYGNHSLIPPSSCTNTHHTIEHLIRANPSEVRTLSRRIYIGIIYFSSGCRRTKNKTNARAQENAPIKIFPGGKGARLVKESYRIIAPTATKPKLNNAAHILKTFTASNLRITISYGSIHPFIKLLHRDSPLQLAQNQSHLTDQRESLEFGKLKNRKRYTLAYNSGWPSVPQTTNLCFGSHRNHVDFLARLRPWPSRLRSGANQLHYLHPIICRARQSPHETSIIQLLAKKI
jgi:hypothetical protein